MWRIDGLPLHPLVVHAVAVLLPLAALGGIVIALRAAWRRRYGWVVFALAVVATATIPVATRSGEQLQAVLPPQNQLIAQHAEMGDDLLPFAVAFVVAVALLLVAGRRADAEREAALATARAEVGGGGGDSPAGAAGPGSGPVGATARRGADDAAAGRDTAVVTRANRTQSTTWRRLAIVAAALVAFTGIAATVQVVRIGHSGSTAVWDGVGQN